MRDRGAQQRITNRPLGTKSSHRHALSRRALRHGESARSEKTPPGMLEMQQRALAIRVEASEIRERRAGVSQTELPGWGGKHDGCGRLVRAEVGECGAR